MARNGAAVDTAVGKIKLLMESVPWEHEENSACLQCRGVCACVHACSSIHAE